MRELEAMPGDRDNSAAIDLASTEEFILGGAVIKPSRRLICWGGDKKTELEPRVMQVLVALASARGDVVSRDKLIELCWGGRIVGDDAISRCIQVLRHVSHEIEPPAFSVETIPRVGYALVESAAPPEARTGQSPASPAALDMKTRRANRLRFGAAAALLLIAIFAAIMLRRAADAGPTVAVSAANQSPGSQALSRDVFVRLGELAQLDLGNWRLAEAGERRADLLFKATDASSGNQPGATLVLSSGRDGTVLWSGNFEFPAGRTADLRHQVSLTAARVLRCALEADKGARLPAKLLKVFLAGCADFAEIYVEPRTVTAAMTKVVEERPKFAPAWSRLLLAQGELVTRMRRARDPAYPAERESLSKYIAAAELADPELPEIFLARATMLPATAYGERLELVDRAIALGPENPEVHSANSHALFRVGRLTDSIHAAGRAVMLDPLSPGVHTELIITLAVAGRTDAARAELAKAERVWEGTEALRQAQYLFHLRYGDPKIALRMAGEYGDLISTIFLQYRLDPSEESAARFVEQAKRYAARAQAYPLQGLAAAHATDEVFALIARTPTMTVVENADMLFRPQLAEVRADPRFLQVAKRIGLLDYWHQSGRWPDFCGELQLPYDCKETARPLLR